MEPQLNLANKMDSQSKWAKPEDWSKYRNTITALFMCHSLPNVMRIMREEHQFHATPKMFQVQIYRKWGIRKGRPENKNSKKRRRIIEEYDVDEDEDEPDIDGLDGEDDGADRDEAEHPRTTTAQRAASSISGGGSDSPHGTNSFVLVHRQDADPQPYPLDQWDTPEISMPADHHLQMAANLAAPGSQMAANFDQRHGGPIPPPVAWKNFVAPQPPMYQFQGHGVGPPSQSDDQHFSYVDDMDDSARGSEWRSTVLVPTPATSDASSHPLGSQSLVRSIRTHPSAAPSRVSKASSKPRRSYASSSRTTLLSSESSSSRSSRSKARSGKAAGGTMTLPLGSLRHLNAPDGLLMPEKSMFFARHYISSTFSTGLWTLSQTADTCLLDTECVKLDRWYNDFNPGLDLLREGGVDAAFRIFQRCFAATKDIIEPQDPRVGIYIIQQAIRFMFFDTLGRNLAGTLLKYVTALCKELFSLQHPLCIILNQLARMDNFEFAQNIPALMNCYFDHLEPFLDQTSDAFRFVSDLRGLTVSLMEATGMIGLYEAKPMLEQLLKRAKQFGHKNLHLQIEVAAMYQRNRFFVEARHMLEELRSSEEAHKHPYENVYAGIVLMVTLRRMKLLNESASVGYNVVEYLTSPLDSTKVGSEFNEELFKSQQHSSLVLVLRKLEKDLRDANRIDEADQVLHRLDNIVAEEYGVEEIPADPQAELESLHSS